MDVASLYFVGRRLILLAERAMAAPEGLPAQPTAELLVLRAVIEHPGLTVTELAAQLAIAQSRISQVVATLERHGLVRRYADASDRRRQRIKPTEHFQEDVERRMARGVNDALDPLFVGVTAREKARLLAALSRLHELIRRADQRESPESREEPRQASPSASASPPASSPPADSDPPARSAPAPPIRSSSASAAGSAGRSRAAAPRRRRRRSAARRR
jgi:DNA-binding MarR family transcriptional regulator